MDGTTVVVTGAAGGLGRAVVTAFADEGATVVAGDRADSGVDGLGDDREDVHAVTADVRDEYDVERLMERAARAGGAIDVVVPCAFISHVAPGTPLQAVAYAAYDDAMRTNARGVFAAIREAVPHLAADARVLVPAVGPLADDTEAGAGVTPVSTAAATALGRGFAADLEQVVGVLALGRVASEGPGDEARDPAAVAPMVVWAAREAAPDRLDGRVVDVKTWVAEERRGRRDAAED